MQLIERISVMIVRSILLKNYNDIKLNFQLPKYQIFTIRNVYASERPSGGASL